MNVDTWLDQAEARMASDIRRVGWMIHYIGGATCSRPGCHPESSDEPPFAYTTGLFGMAHPELVIVGLDAEPTAMVVNDLAQRVKDGDMIMPGQLYTGEGWPHRIVPEPLPNPGDILLWTNSYYLRPAEYSVPALQLTYDDDQGLFPWDEGYAHPEQQPRPGSFTA